MIDTRREKLIGFGEAAQLMPAKPNGTRVHPVTIGRWARAGLNGVVLESVRLGRLRMTSQEAMHRFIERLSCQDAGQSLVVPDEGRHAELRRRGLA